MRHGLALLTIALATPAGAQSLSDTGMSAEPTLAGFSLAPFVADERPAVLDDRRRYLLPEVADRYGPVRPPPKLRIRGRRLKLRVPLG